MATKKVINIAGDEIDVTTKTEMAEVKTEVKKPRAKKIGIVGTGGLAEVKAKIAEAKKLEEARVKPTWDTPILEIMLDPHFDGFIDLELKKVRNYSAPAGKKLKVEWEKVGTGYTPETLKQAYYPILIKNSPLPSSIRAVINTLIQSACASTILHYEPKKK